MSVTITIQNAVKRYGNVTVIPDLSVTIRNGELFTLFGTVRCGKNNSVWMIAGFNTIEGGSFKFNNRLINDMEPGKRGIGMVFQNYAIFPNMTVRKNIEFGLKYKDMPKEQMRKQAQKFLELVSCRSVCRQNAGTAVRRASERVALARALVIQPDVLLMDEPLSNLDAKLRVEMRTVIKNIQKEVGITTVYVTHDQEGGNGNLRQNCSYEGRGDPPLRRAKNIYQRPADLFVATFIGKSNLLNAKLMQKDGEAVLEFRNGYRICMDSVQDSEIREQDVTLSVRPEELFVHNWCTEGGEEGRYQR